MPGYLCLLTAATLAFASAGAFAQSRPGEVDRKTYSWVDERGVRHYGDSVPAQYAKREQRVLNNQGVEVQRRAAQKSPEEIARETELNREASRRKQHDMFLLSTYSSVRDLENVRDERLATLEGQVRAAQAYIDNLDDRMRGLRERAMLFRPYNAAPSARRMPDQLAEEIIRTLNEQRTQGRALDAKRDEHNALREQFELDIVRYRELKSGKLASAQR
jgi:DNA primase